MDLPEIPARLGVKIERPVPEKIGFVYILLVFASFIFISLTVWVLVLEWTGKPLPAFLKLPVTW